MLLASPGERGEDPGTDHGQVGLLPALQAQPVLLAGGGRLAEPDQVHLDPQVFHQQLPRNPANTVERVVGVRVGGSWGYFYLRLSENRNYICDILRYLW